MECDKADQYSTPDIMHLSTKQVYGYIFPPEVL